MAVDVEEPLGKLYGGIYYDPKNPANLNDFQNRQLFLRAAEQKVPGFSYSLFAAIELLILTRIERCGSLPKPKSPDFEAFYSHVFAGIRSWAKSFNIDVEWVHQDALSAVWVKLFRLYKGLKGSDVFGIWRRNRRLDKMRSFELPAWDPLSESGSAYVARADDEWQRQREEYLAHVKGELEAQGYKQVPTRRQRRLDPEARFEWAAVHRCTGKSIEAVADEYLEDTETVRISVARVLADLGFQEPT